MLRTHFIKKSISTDDAEYIIGHNGSIYLRMTLGVIVLLFLLYGIFWLLTTQAGVELLQLKWIFAGAGIVLLGKYVVDFLNLYLDGLALSKSGITLVLWEGLLQYKTEYFDRERISTIHHQQSGLWDTIFHRGDLVIVLEHGIEFPFENITAPKKQVDKIMNLKSRFAKKQTIEDLGIDGMNTNNDKMQIFMEAFGEVMKDFMDKDGKGDTI